MATSRKPLTEEQRKGVRARMPHQVRGLQKAKDKLQFLEQQLTDAKEIERLKEQLTRSQESKDVKDTKDSKPSDTRINQLTQELASTQQEVTQLQEQEDELIFQQLEKEAKWEQERQKRGINKEGKDTKQEQVIPKKAKGAPPPQVGIATRKPLRQGTATSPSQASTTSKPLKPQFFKESKGNLSSNYFSYEFQSNSINNHLATVWKSLQDYKSSRSELSDIDKDFSSLLTYPITDQLDPQKWESAVINGLLEEIKETAKKTQQKIDNNRINNIGNDSVLITQHYSSMYANLNLAIKLLQKLKDPPFSLIQELNYQADLCKSSIEHFKNGGMEINIYKVKIPEDEYKKMMDDKTHTKKLWYEGEVVSHVQKVGGPLQAIISGGLLALEVGTIAPIVADGIFLKGQLAEGLFHSTAAGINTAIAGFSHYGYSAKLDFPSTWIDSRVDIFEFEQKGKTTTKSGLTEERMIVNDIETNPHKQSASKESKEKFQEVFILDGRNPKDVFQHGTNYHLGKNNPHGHVIFFHHAVDAHRCKMERLNGQQYDATAGWRRNHSWTDSERQTAHTNIQQEQKKEQKLESKR